MVKILTAWFCKWVSLNFYHGLLIWSVQRMCEFCDCQWALVSYTMSHTCCARIWLKPPWKGASKTVSSGHSKAKLPSSSIFAVEPKWDFGQSANSINLWKVHLDWQCISFHSVFHTRLMTKTNVAFFVWTLVSKVKEINVKSSFSEHVCLDVLSLDL